MKMLWKFPSIHELEGQGRLVAWKVRKEMHHEAFATRKGQAIQVSAMLLFFVVVYLGLGVMADSFDRQ